MKHFGEGGFVDYLLSEIFWVRGFGRDIEPGKFIGEHKKGDGNYEYHAPFYWWDDFIKVPFRRAVGEGKLKTSMMELR